MAALPPPPSTPRTLAELRGALAQRHAGALPLPPGELIPSGLPELDAALAGGVPKGIIATLEGGPSSGRTALAVRLLAQAQGRGLVAILDARAAFAPALERAGVDPARLIVVDASEPRTLARSADIIVRSGAFSAVVIPALPLPANAWTRLGMLAHRSGTVLLTIGAEASTELAYFAALRIGLRIERVRWEGEPGLFCTLAGYDVRAAILKHKRAAPGRHALFSVRAFEGFCDADHLHDRAVVPARGRLAGSPRERFAGAAGG